MFIEKLNLQIFTGVRSQHSWFFVLLNSQSRRLREKMYMAFITRASQGDTDNSEIIEEIRQLRYFDIYITQVSLLTFTFCGGEVRGGGVGNKDYQSKL